jgi:hypothetical protein
MTTAPLYFGNEMDAFIPSDTSVIEVTTANTFDATYTRCSIVTLINQNFKSIQFPSQTGGVYFNFCLSYGPTGSQESALFDVLDSSGTTVFQMTGFRNSGGSFLAKMYYFNGASLVAIGNGATVAFNLQYFTIYLNKATGTATMYVGGSQQDTGTVGSFASINNFAQVLHQSGTNGQPAYWSQCFASVSPTIGQRLYTLVEDTNGAAQDWTGDVTDVNELVVNDATGITSGSVNQVSTYLKSGLSTSGVILGIGTSARFNVGATGPQNIQNVLRVGGTNYTSPSTLGTTGFAPAQYMWMTNPATSTSWTNVAANGVEWGVKSIT